MTTVSHHGVSDQGRVRFKNEDFILTGQPADEAQRAKKGVLFVVADGVGGHGAGEVASSEACRALVEAYYASARKPESALRSAFNKTNLHVFDLGVETNQSLMSTTLSAIAIVGNQLHIAHIGDSRIYRIRGAGRIEQLTQDHSEVAELVRMNILSPDRVRNHPRRSIITRSLGSQPVAQPMFRSDTILPEDVFVMCTDGVWEPVADSDIADIAGKYAPEEACRKLIERGLEGQSTDNLSVQVIRVLSVDEEPLGSTENWWHKLLKLLGIKRKAEGVRGSSLCS